MSITNLSSIPEDLFKIQLAMNNSSSGLVPKHMSDIIFGQVFDQLHLPVHQSVNKFKYQVKYACRPDPDIYLPVFPIPKKLRIIRITNLSNSNYN